MSILIKGMEMPKSCWVCEVGGAAQMDNATCPFYSMEYWEQENYQDKIADGCPLVPVPPHGRLIDADALANKHRTMAYEDGGRKYSFHASAKSWVEEAPTIIPAQTEKEGE